MKIEDPGFEGELVNGLREGKWILRYDPEDAQSPLKKEAHYAGGLLHGLYAEYWQSGFRMYCVFEQGVPHGACKFYYNNGQIRYAGHFQHGKKHGEWISYGSNERSIASVEYERGFQVGYSVSASFPNWKEPLFNFKVAPPQR